MRHGRATSRALILPCLVPALQAALAVTMAAAWPVMAGEFVSNQPANAVAGTLDADSWIVRCPDAEQVLLDAAAVHALNRRMLAAEPSINDLAVLPETMEGRRIAERIHALGSLPDRRLHAADGTLVTADDRRRWLAALSIDTIPANVEPRYGLVVRRAAVRRFPTRERVLANPTDADIDAFQETAFFPGTPVAVVHATTAGDWRFVIGPTYAGWVSDDAIACGTRDEVLGYADRCSRVVTAARVTTAFTSELPAVSQLVLDMGTTLPERHDWPAGSPVNGQSPAASVVVEVPIRGRAGRLEIVPALVPRAADTRAGPLPASRATVLRQAFRFLGERYGWGHDFEGRDCSGFVCDVYRSVGIVLPRNTRDQAVCPALAATPVAGDWPRERRLEALEALLPGDLVFTRRHVMMVVGRDGRGPWVIHDTHEGRTAGAAANGVVVQPLAEVDDGRVADFLTALVRVLPPPPGQQP
ncbi:MAG: SH3 domain-containing protein [Planctomycetaceae bacterium]